MQNEEVKKTIPKKCPCCEEVKTTDDFYKHWNKKKEKYKFSSYCKVCQSKKFKEKYREPESGVRKRILDYNVKYRKDKPEKLKEYKIKNKEVHKAYAKKYRTQYRKNLGTGYVVERAKKFFNLNTEQMKANPELLETYKLNLKIKRIIKENGKKQT